MDSHKREQVLRSMLNDQGCNLVYSREEAEQMLRKDIENHLVRKIDGDTGAVLDAIEVLEQEISTEDFVHRHHIYTKDNFSDFFMQSEIDELEKALSLVREFQLATLKWYFHQTLSEKERIEVEKEILYRRSLKEDERTTKVEMTPIH